MVEHFFKLAEHPFKQTPQAKFFYPHSGVKSAYASLLNGIKENHQALLLTGATGTGKSICVQKLIEELDNAPRYACINLPFSSLSYDDVLSIICTGLNLRFGLEHDEEKIDILETFIKHGQQPDHEYRAVY